MQDKAGKSGEVPGENSLGKPFLPDKVASLGAPFESRLFDHLSTAPYMAEPGRLRNSYYTKLPFLRQMDSTKIITGKGERPREKLLEQEE